MSKYKNLIAVIILIVTFSTGLEVGKQQLRDEYNSLPFDLNDENDQSVDSNLDIDLSLIREVWKLVESDYVDYEPLSKQEVVHGMAKGLVDSIGDPYSIFMTPDESKEFASGLNGELEGIGAELTIRDGNITVVSPLKGSPAEAAGIESNDVIYKIEEEVAFEMSLFEAISKIKGPAGTDIRLTLIRQGEEEPVEVTITRQKINIPSVELSFVEGNIAHLEINQFGDNTQEEFNNAISQILLATPKGIIIDLRGNGGGYLSVAENLVSDFLTKDKEIVTIRRRDSSLDETKYTDGRARLLDFPVVVLVNGSSASASEILAGAIQDHERGTVIGKQTFGKGSVQEIVGLKDGSSLRITVAKWLRPSGIDIEEIGVTPDQIVEYRDEENEDSEEDMQLKAAIEALN